MRIRTPSNHGSIHMMYIRMYVTVTLRNVVNQGSYVLLSRGRRVEPVNIRRRP